MIIRKGINSCCESNLFGLIIKKIPEPNFLWTTNKVCKAKEILKNKIFKRINCMKSVKHTPIHKRLNATILKIINNERSKSYDRSEKLNSLCEDIKINIPNTKNNSNKTSMKKLFTLPNDHIKTKYKGYSKHLFKNVKQIPPINERASQIILEKKQHSERIITFENLLSKVHITINKSIDNEINKPNIFSSLLRKSSQAIQRLNKTLFINKRIQTALTEKFSDWNNAVCNKNIIKNN